ncbi:hypothetical protein U1Q18_038872 [Sarracenia purpurea var. burkii]
MVQFVSLILFSVVPHSMVHGDNCSKGETYSANWQCCLSSKVHKGGWSRLGWSTVLLTIEGVAKVRLPL